MTHTKKQDRAITRTAGAARLSPWRLARGWAKRNMMRLLAMPSTRKAGHPEHPADLVPPAQGVGLGDGLGHGHRQAGLGDHQQQVVDGVGVVEVAEAHVPQDAAQGDLVQGANDFDHRNAGGQDGRAAKEGICGECSFLQNSPSLRITRFFRLRRGGAGRRTSPRPGSSPGPG